MQKGEEVDDLPGLEVWVEMEMETGTRVCVCFGWLVLWREWERGWWYGNPGKRVHWLEEITSQGSSGVQRAMQAESFYIFYLSDIRMDGRVVSLLSTLSKSRTTRSLQGEKKERKSLNYISIFLKKYMIILLFINQILQLHFNLGPFLQLGGDHMKNMVINIMFPFYLIFNWLDIFVGKLLISPLTCRAIANQDIVYEFFQSRIYVFQFLSIISFLAIKVNFSNKFC